MGLFKGKIARRSRGQHQTILLAELRPLENMETEK